MSLQGQSGSEDNTVIVPSAQLCEELTAGARSLFESQDFTDVVFRIVTKTGFRELGAHRFILSIRSSFFAERFQDEDAWSSKATILCETDNYDVMSSILEYIYKDELIYAIFTGDASLHNTLRFLAQLTVEAIRYRLSRLVALCNSEMIKLIEKAKADKTSLMWHENVLMTLMFGQRMAERYPGYYFNLDNACLNVLSSPRPMIDCERSDFLKSLRMELDPLEYSKEAPEPKKCSAETCVRILLVRCRRREAVMENAILSGRPDVVNMLLQQGITGESMRGDDELCRDLSPLELALFLSSMLSNKNGSYRKHDRAELKRKYAFTLDWLKYEDIYEISVSLISHVNLNDSEKIEENFRVSGERKGDCLLGLASMNGRINHVQVLLDEGMDVNAPVSGKSPIHIAASYGHADVVKVLIERGAAPNLQDDFGNTALHLACRENNGMVPVVAVLLSTNDCSSSSSGRRPLPNINIPDREGWTALHIVAKNGNVECCRLLLAAASLSESEDGLRDLLLAADYDRGSTALHIAASFGNTQIVEEIILHVRNRSIVWPDAFCNHSFGFNPNATPENRKKKGNQEDSYNETCKGVGPLVNFGDLGRHTPIHQVAILIGNMLNDVNFEACSKLEEAYRCLEVLLENDASALSQTIVGYTPIHCLLGGGIHSGGISVNSDKKSRNPNSFASLRKMNKFASEIRRPSKSNSEFKKSNYDERSTAILRPLNSLLNAKGGNAAIFVVAKDGVTPLHCAVRFSHPSAAAVLVRRGADVHARDIFNDSPLSLARDHWPFPLLAEHILKILPSAPAWAEDSLDHCESCTTLFSVTVRRHHCRHCGSIVCSDCSSRKMRLPRFGIDKHVRVCTACFEALSWPCTSEYSNSHAESTGAASDEGRTGRDKVEKQSLVRTSISRKSNSPGHATRVRKSRNRNRHQVVMED